MRKSIELDYIGHGTMPVPYASRIGNVLMSGGIMGHDLAGKMAETPAEQARNMFANIRNTVEAAGGSVADIIKINFFYQTGLDRAVFNPYWLELFPDAASRPARKTLELDLRRGNIAVEADIMAVIGAGKRRSIELDYIGHGTMPVPYASRIGNLLMSGGIMGHDLAGKMAETPAEQARNMFANIRNTVEAAGGSVADIIKINFFYQTGLDRAVFNPYWLELFPDAASRPARKTLELDLRRGNIAVEADIMAVIE